MSILYDISYCHNKTPSHIRRHISNVNTLELILIKCPYADLFKLNMCYCRVLRVDILLLHCIHLDIKLANYNLIITYNIITYNIQWLYVPTSSCYAEAKLI